MTFSEIAAIGELVGTVGVLITLIYLAVQIRQNTHAIRTSAVQSVTETVATNASNIAISPENALLFRSGFADFDSFSDMQKAQFIQIMASILLSIDSVYWLYINKSLPREIWQREENALRVWLKTPGGRAAWEQGLVSDGLREHVESHVLQPTEK
jgi:hypothetical protein